MIAQWNKEADDTQAASAGVRTDDHVINGEANSSLCPTSIDHQGAPAYHGMP